MSRIATERFRKLLRDRGETSHSIARKLGLAPSTVWRIETCKGPFRDCHLGTLIKLAHALKTSPSFLADAEVTVQADIWPVLVEKGEPPERLVFQQLQTTPDAIRVAAARDAMSAIMAAQRANGYRPPKEAYEALYVLDAIRPGSDKGPSASKTA